MAAQPDHDPPDSREHALATIRAELAHVRSAVGRIERGLVELEASDRAATRSSRKPERYLQVLVDVYERGGRHGVSAEAWSAIGDRLGYDRRGLGGFFTGARAPLRHTQDRVALTVYGERLVDEYLSRLPT